MFITLSTLVVHLLAGRSAEAGGRKGGREGRKEGKNCFGGKLLVHMGKGLGGRRYDSWLKLKYQHCSCQGKRSVAGGREVPVEVTVVRHGVS